jgi:hypothetical protein
MCILRNSAVSSTIKYTVKHLKNILYLFHGGLSLLSTAMICRLCGKDKLSNEFPHEHLTDECTEQHPLLHCLRVSII